MLPHMAVVRHLCLVGAFSALSILPAAGQEILGSHLRYQIREAGGAAVTNLVNITKTGHILISQVDGKPCPGQSADKKIGDEAILGRIHTYAYSCGTARFRSKGTASYANGTLRIEIENRSSAGTFRSTSSIRISGGTCSGNVRESFNGRPQGSWTITSCSVGSGIGR